MVLYLPRYLLMEISTQGAIRGRRRESMGSSHPSMRIRSFVGEEALEVNNG